MKKRVTSEKEGTRDPRRIRVTGHWSLLVTCHLFLLSGCGFQPLHSKTYQQSQPVDLASVAIEIAGDRSASDVTQHETNVARRYSELFKAEIDERTHHAAPVPRQFTLLISLSEQQSAQFVNPDGTASRGTLTYASSYTVTRLSDQKQIATGSLSRGSSFNTAPNADYTSYVSLEDARRRAIIELAQAYTLRLTQLVPTLANPHAGEVKPKDDKPVPVLQPAPNYETLRARH